MLKLLRDYKGKNNPFSGRKHSEETKLKMRMYALSKSNESSQRIMGNKNPQWKGNDVGYKGLHIWVRNHLPKPEKCEICIIKKPHDLANKTGIYDRDFKNWYWLCRRCHMESDGRSITVLNNLTQFRSMNNQ